MSPKPNERRNKNEEPARGEYEKRLAPLTNGRPMENIALWLESAHREVRRSDKINSVLLRRRFDFSIEKVWRACTEREPLLLRRFPPRTSSQSSSCSGRSWE